MDKDQLNLLSRWYELRKRRLLYPLLHDPVSGVWRFTEPSDPWGSKVRLDWVEFGKDVEEAESRDSRKPIRSECNAAVTKELFTSIA